MGRAPCCDKANVKKGPWSPEEDAVLKEYIEKNGTGGNWIALPQKIGIKRCGKSCRLRWLNYLRPNIKHGGFTEEEDNIICNLYISIGSRWSIIAAQLPGRTDNDIKNYWNTRLKKKLLGRRKHSRMNRMSSSLSENDREIANNNNNNNDPEENPFLQNLSSSALERLQLHMHLQNLQNPISNFYTNPSLWPKFHNLMLLQTLENISTMQKTPLLPINLPDHPVELLENSANGTLLSSSSSSQPNDLIMYHGVKEYETNVITQNVYVQKEEGLGLNQTLMIQNDHIEGVGFETLEGQIAELDCCLKQMEDDNSRDGIAWWSSNDIIASNSTSSDSWESASFLLQSDGMYRDSSLWYNNM